MFFPKEPKENTNTRRIIIGSDEYTYSLKDKLGDGDFGVVYKAKHLKTKETVAVKIIDAEYELIKQEPPILEQHIKEAINMGLAKQYAVEGTKPPYKYYIVLPYCEKFLENFFPIPPRFGSDARVASSEKIPSVIKRLEWAKQMMEYVKQLHNKEILHGQLYLRHIGLDKNGKVIIIGFHYNIKKDDGFGSDQEIECLLPTIFSLIAGRDLYLGEDLFTKENYETDFADCPSIEKMLARITEVGNEYHEISSAEIADFIDALLQEKKNAQAKKNITGEKRKRKDEPNIDTSLKLFESDKKRMKI